MNFILKNTKKIFFLLLLSSFTLGIAQAQVTIWSQDFTTATIGTASQVSGVISTANNMGWSFTGTPTNYAQVVAAAQDGTLGGQGATFEIERSGVTITWASDALDIAGHTSINLSLFIHEDLELVNDNLEDGDFYSVFYRIDGGGRIPFTTNASAINDFVDRTASSNNIVTSGAPGSTITIEVDMETSSANEHMSIDDILVTSNQPLVITNPIATCVDVSGGDFTFDVDYNAAGTLNAPNIFTVQLSDATGSFAVPSTIGIFTSTAAVGTISSTIPAATANGTAYRIRVVASDAATTGTDNGSNISIFDSQTISITPTGNQTFASNATGAPLTSNASEGTTEAIRWGYRNTPLGVITDFAPAETGISYTPDGTDFPATGTYYVVAQTQACGTGTFLIISNEVQVTITDPVLYSISGNVFIDALGDGVNDLTDAGDPAVTVRMYEDTNDNGLFDGGDLLLDTQITDANGDYTFDITTGFCVRVNNDNDDAEQIGAGGISLGSTDLELVEEGGLQSVGMVFDGFPIPRGATILASSYLEFTLDENHDRLCTLTIRGINTGSAVDFATQDINSRGLTAAVAPWVIPLALDLDEDDILRTNNFPSASTDISGVITEIINRVDWNSGNNIGIIINGTNSAGNGRAMESHDGEPASAPQLCINYTLTGQNYLIQVETGGFPAEHIITTTSATVLVTAATANTGASNVDFGYSVPNNAIINFTETCMDISGGALNFDVDYSLISANYTVGNTLTLQLSDAVGSFAAPTNIGTLNTTLSTGTITGAIPALTPSGSGYRIRILSSNPAITGTDNGTDINIFNTASIAVTPISAQAFAVNTIGAPLTATSTGGTSGTIQWGYRTISGGAITNFAPPETSTVYTPEGADFAGEGTYFVVAMTQPCAGGAFSIISNEVTITLTTAIVLAPNTITGNAFFDINGNSLKELIDIGENGVGVTLFEDTNGNGIIDGGDLSLLTTTTDALGNYSFSIVTGLCVSIGDNGGSGADDSEEYIALPETIGEVNDGSSDLELIEEDANQAIAMLFRGMAIPAGANIVSSYLEFVSKGTHSTNAVLTINGELLTAPTINPSDLTETDFDITGRAITTGAAWTLIPSDIWNDGATVQSVDISNIMTEIINVSTWATGNNLVMMINNEGGGNSGTRNVHSGDTGTPPTLCVNFTTGKDYLIQVDRTDFPAGHTLTTTSATILVTAANASSGAATSVNFGYSILANNIINFAEACMDISTGNFNFNVDYALSGAAAYNIGNDLTVQLSNTTGGFVGFTTIGTLATTLVSGTIAASIPFGTAASANYRIRIVSTDFALTSNDNGTDINIFDDASLSIAPLGSQTFTTAATGVLLTTTAGNGTSGNIQWSYRTISSGATVNFAPVITGTTYTPAGADFPSAGTYYLVATTQPCSTASFNIISNEIEIVITNLANTITTVLPECMDVSTASLVLNLAFDGGGGYNAGNNLTLELSNTTGGFVGASTVGTLTNYTFSSGSIVATIPMGTAFGTAYRMRLVSSDPAFAGADNGIDITIFNQPNITVAPISSQSFDNLSSGVAVTATTGNGTNGLVHWYYRTVPGGALNEFTPAQTGATYTPNALNFPGIGTFYMVAATVPCGTVLFNAISQEIEITITAAPNSISGNVFLDLNSDGVKGFNDKGQAAIRLNLYRDNNGDGVIDGGDTQLSTTLSDAVGNYSFSAGQIQLCTPIIATNDDAEQSGAVDLNSSDLDLDNSRNIGLRFQNVPVPPGVAILSAYLEFTVDENQDPATNLTINGELTNNAINDFNAVDINSRLGGLITSSVNWNIPASEDWTAPSIVTSSDISGIISEITALGGWAAGNDMVMLISANNAGGRAVETFDGGAPPSLCIVYAGLNYLIELETVDLGPGAVLTIPATNVRSVSGAAVLVGASGNDFGYDGETTGCYAIADGGNDMYIINRFTGENYEVGANGVSDIEAMAIDVFNDKVYATNGGELGSIDPLTGVYTTIGGGAESIDGSAGNISIDDIDGLTMDPFAGILYGSQRQGGADIFFQIDIGTGLVIRDAYGAGIDYVEITGAGVGNDIDDFMINPFSGIMYAANSSGGTYSSQLVTIDYQNPGAGNATLIGSFDNGNGGANFDIEGIGSSDCGAVYVTSGDGASLLEVDVATGAATLVGAFIGGSDFEAADCLFAPANRLLGNVADDTNGNGFQDGGEGGLANVTVYLYSDENDNDIVDAGDILLQETATDANGDYVFKVAGVVGNFVIQVDESDYPAGYVATTDDVEDESYLACSLGTDFPNNNFGARDFNILPITLVKFTAVLNEDNDVLLEWTTANETDNSFFTIERSRDWQDPTTFTAILTVDGNGTTYRQNNYSAIDYELLEGVYYYRLKQTDIDGAFTYSKIVAIQIRANAEQEKEITLFPNPLGNQNLNFKLKGFAPNQNLNILIYDTMGRLVLAKDMNILSNVVEVPIQEHRLAAGAYVVRIVSGDEIFYKKLIVRK